MTNVFAEDAAAVIEPATDEAPRGAPESQAADRVVRILNAIGDAPAPIGVAEIAAALGVHRSIVYRFLKTLTRENYVRVRPNGRFELGSGIVLLAQQVRNNPQEVARPYLQQLADACEATAFITELDDDKTVCLLSVEPVASRTHLIFRPGTIGPIDRGAAVMAIYAADDKFVNLYQESQLARERGYAWSTGQITPGIECVACPIQLPKSTTPSSVAVIYPTGSRVVEEVAQEVVMAASALNAAFAS